MEQQQIKNNNIQTSQNVSNPDEIDLAELMGKLLRKKKFIITTTITFMVLGLLIALLSPKQFTAGCTVVPQTTGGRSGNMSGLAAMAGINLGSSGTSDGVLSPNTYPDIVKSVPFTREIMQTRITTPRAGGDTITLFDFYTDKQYQKFNIISAVKRYTIGLPGLILSQIIKPAEQPDAGDSSATPTVYTLDKREQFAYKAIQNSMSVNLDPKNGIVKLSYVFPEPKGAALAAEQLRVTLGEYVKQFKIEKVEENLAFIEHNYHLLFFLLSSYLLVSSSVAILMIGLSDAVILPSSTSRLPGTTLPYSTPLAVSTMTKLPASTSKFCGSK